MGGGDIFIHGALPAGAVMNSAYTALAQFLARPHVLYEKLKGKVQFGLFFVWSFHIAKNSFHTLMVIHFSVSTSIAK